MLELYPSEEHFNQSADEARCSANTAGADTLPRSTLTPFGGAASAIIVPEETVHLDFSNLNITSEEIDFDEIDDDLERFQEDDMVKQALHRGVDLRKYGQELSLQLKEVVRLADLINI